MTGAAANALPARQLPRAVHLLPPLMPASALHHRAALFSVVQCMPRP